MARRATKCCTLLRLADGSHLMVNRGWVPFSGYRDRLPDVALPGRGRAAPGGPPFHAAGDRYRVGQGAAGRGRSLAAGHQFSRAEELAHLWGEKLLAPVLLLDAGSGPGYLRDWKPPGVSPDRNYSYAIQWWSFALLAVAMFIGLNLKRRA